MWDLLVLIITIFIVYISVKTFYDNESIEVDYVTSDYDQKQYLVRNLPDKDEAARLLSLIKDRLVKLVTHLKQHYPQDTRIIKLYERFDPDRISESSANNAYTSYSINKGEKIVFCLRQRDNDEHILDLNTMVFVAIHELAHIMTESVGHTQEFWNNMKFLLQIAMSSDVQIYQYQPYHKMPQKYCGTSITDTPLKL